jgi:MFS family permease
MLDELDLLKKDWQKKETNLPRLTYEEIYKMIWKKSSSVVRWIFYISIIEFLLPHLLYLIPSFRNEMDYNFAKSLGINNWIIALTIIQYAVAIYFIFQFYRRYREISVLDDAKKLMKKIFRTRRTVKHYVLFCLVMVLLIFGVFIVGMALDDNLVETLNIKNQNVDPDQLKWLLIGVMTVAGILFTGVLAGIYFLLYGLLTRKLSRNYIELKRMEA